MNEEWLSAHLDGELDDVEEAELEAALAADPVLAATYGDLARVRSLLRSETSQPLAGAIEQIIASVDAADESTAEQLGSPAPRAPVVTLASHRRVPRFAAAAAAMVIIASVVGGVGGGNSLPAIGDLIAQHDAAAAVVEGEPMPDDMDHMDPMPMDKALSMAPLMPDDLSMEHAFLSGPTLHLLYVGAEGESISVFRHEGETDLASLDGDGLAESDHRNMWSGPAGGSYVVVIDGTGFVWIIVSEKPHNDMIGDMMDDLPTRSPSLGDRVRGTADTIVDTFRFWD
ncbi:MAG: hypothetical protein ACI9C1_002602 [Candidatus Aldehydirespiratoraceae bacterium]|jgi:hypothetical protein